jgi:hypothetical protein
MNHKAIYALYPNVVSVDDSEGAKDVNGNSVEIDMDAVNAWVDPEQYAIDRSRAYPSIQEQLDMQYWDSVNGTTTWKDAIEAVKTEHPKP